jgi:hypothetical protein
MRRTSVVNAVQNRLRRLLAVAVAMLTFPALAVVVGPTLQALKPDLIAPNNGDGATRHDTR